MANSADTTYSFVKETVAGTTPATPAFLGFDYSQGDTLNPENDTLVPTNLRKNRSVGSVRKTNNRSGGSLKTQLKLDPAISLNIESGIDGAFTSKVAKAGNTDISMTVEKAVKEGASTLYQRFPGQRVNSISVSAEASGNAEIGFGYVGLKPVMATAAISGATYAASANTTPLTGVETTLTIAGVTAVFRSVELTVEINRATKDALGSVDVLGIGTGGSRSVKLSATLYRTADDAIDTLLASDASMLVTLTIGTTGDGYKFELPAAVSTILPQSEQGDVYEMLKVEFQATDDATALTDLIVTQL